VAVVRETSMQRLPSIADIAAEVENDRQESVMKLTQAHEVSAKMVHATLHKDLLLSKKCRWVTKMVY
jgi:hypothetical protein